MTLISEQKADAREAGIYAGDRRIWMETESISDRIRRAHNKALSNYIGWHIREHVGPEAPASDADLATVAIARKNEVIFIQHPDPNVEIAATLWENGRKVCDLPRPPHARDFWTMR